MFRNNLFHAHFWPDPFPAPENCNMVRTSEIPPMFLKHVAKNTQFFDMTAPYFQRGADHFLDRHVAWLQIMTVLSKFLQLKLRYGYVLFQVGEKSIVYRCADVASARCYCLHFCIFPDFCAAVGIKSHQRR